MNSRTIDVVTDWGTVATPAGYEGLRQLAADEFSGAVSAGPAWAFFLNGRIVGVFEGTIEDFETADSTAYRAADPSLPLLFAMQERGGETRANYYTNETPLREVDETLSSGGFTGYIELSENVLSGDYYVVYHGGKSMSAAFVGNSERLVTGEEAFETAADEVGIYNVVDVDVDLVDIPEPEPGADEGEIEDDTEGTATTGAGAAADAADDGGTADSSDATGAEQLGDRSVDDADPGTPDPAPVAELDTTDAAGTEPADDDTESADEDTEPAVDGVAAEPRSDDGEVDDGELESGPDPDIDRGIEPDSDIDRGTDSDSDTDPDIDHSIDSDTDHDVEPDPGADSGSELDPDTESDPDTDVEGDAPPEADTDDAGSEPAEREPAGDAAAADPVAEDDVRSDPVARDDVRSDPAVPDLDQAPPDGTGGTDAGVTSGERSGEAGRSGSADGTLTDEERWQRARTIPSLDPEESSEGTDPEAASDRNAARERTAQMQRQRQRRQAARDRTGSDAARGSAAASESEADSGGDREEFEQLRQRLSRARDRIESLEAEREDLLAERDELVEERDALRSEQAERTERIEELEAECERLRSEVDRLQSRVDAGDEEGSESPSESMSPDRALSGTNLFVRYDSKGQATLKHAHAGDSSRADVRENLRLEHHTTFETEGVVVDNRPYEEFLHDSTEYAFARWVVSDLLYEIGETGNRSELAGVFDAIPDIDRVEIRGEVTVETDDGVEGRAFDVVFRDRMGEPLFVADINPSRNATTDGMVGSLVENTHTVASEVETLAAGFYVTESFYEPGALETVADRTGGGLLSRSSKRSFVKLSRKRGYHLCLVEARESEFHLNVPEL